ncbi:hypothetical protein CO051_00155 [Candidatus Roizmanbacteria bacterium CG_4_9_14_0_2_um_filter_39_13]|uniref:Uncharacterized protein n=2 Tax=Candidatus Roizmaniibacteriota TaxID=1752723 RepID=A0A2M8F4T6_9BACT|nr:MAG: hypothetical protein CO051_00155 [Candidatus Roizmanbacteria bacterium CG_4_9_14_0_2_um_filter_39_13]PJE61869.1 MAG: hypothetical protein COU87_02330 [Candidatus Roizmanbacteria bacterium CG10_big_fil_rev_8_21_14_0_10_39_12]
MRKLFYILLNIALCILILGFVSQDPTQAAGSLYDAQNEKSSEMLVQIDGTVSQKIQEGNVYFISGDFSKAKLDQGENIPRHNMIILNVKDRRFANWQIDTDGPIHDIMVINKLLVIGGSFERVNGSIQKNLAIFDIDTQKILTDIIGADFPVYTFETYEKKGFIGGEFTHITDVDRLRIASYDSEERTIFPWNPQLNGTVFDMLVYQNRLYVVGDFTEVNGVVRKYGASFLLPGGELTKWTIDPNSPIKNISIKDGVIVLTGEGVESFSVEPDVSLVDETAISTVVLSRDEQLQDDLSIHTDELGFKIPTLGDLLTFAIRAFFVIAGLAGLFYLLLGALAWVTSGGDKDSVKAAREKIQATVIGMILIVAVLGIVWTLEQVIFNRRICLGLSCPLTLPSLIEPLSN